MNPPPHGPLPPAAPGTGRPPRAAAPSSCSRLGESRTAPAGAPLLAALALAVGVLALDGLLRPAEAGEPIPLRVLRKAAEHPLRASLGAFLTLWGLWPPGPVKAEKGPQGGQDPDSGVGT